MTCRTVTPVRRETDSSSSYTSLRVSSSSALSGSSSSSTPALHGGSNRDLLIGGDGADRIIGNAGDDILIAGYTTYDTEERALAAIMAEWTADSVSYAPSYDLRVQHLASPGTGCNGAAVFSHQSVLDERYTDQVDILTGSAGSDWFWADDSGGEDRVAGLVPGERVHEI